MNLVFVRYFLAVAETSNFTSAADRCHVTQPTLSAGIARLEDELGTRLFDRGRRVALTMAGQRFLPHARSMIEAWKLARSESRSAGRQRTLRVAIASTVAIDAAMQWLAAVKGREQFAIEISEGSAEAVQERWRRGRCDIGLFPVRHPISGDRLISLFREPYVLAAATTHRIATRDRWSARELADTPFVLRAGCEAHQDAQKAFASEGARPPVVLRSSDEGRCAAAVLAGFGGCFMPRSLLRAGMTAASIRELTLERRVMLAWRSDEETEIATAIRAEATNSGPLAFAR
ncbi:DNA-binding transcriptional regulator, LysR family [Enhydrobacter aerosaccus]|uniref:DNA-binding transcriptional regulator, LysR family n=1 Tax=Enhydrobacter aerosaccus TaxID=225324 RepID=A0A1T4JYR7_9HYPH|nr:LysR family transcriptional regulator [Enhydrobacter aerosaccus]SJZ35197.1 DNA-binding transcriptional regulator, LysR family [Enhydrobacter aerosaccus]